MYIRPEEYLQHYSRKEVKGLITVVVIIISLLLFYDLCEVSLIYHVVEDMAISLKLINM